MIQSTGTTRAFHRGILRRSRIVTPQDKALVGDWAPTRHRESMVWRDNSRFRNHGNLTGWGTPETAFVPGRNGWHPEFDGASTYINAGTRPSLEFTTAFTLIARCRHSDAYSAGLLRGIINKFSTVGPNRSYTFFIWHVAGLRRQVVYISEAGVATTTCFGLVDIDTDWHTFAYTFDHGVWVMFLDGVRVAGGFAGYPAIYTAPTIPFRIGTTWLNTEFLGPIERVMAFDRALNDRELKAIHTRFRDPMGLVAPPVSHATSSRTLFYRRHFMPISLVNDYKYIDGKIDITLDGNVVRNVVMLQSKIKEGEASKGAYLHRETRFQLPTVPAIATPEVGQVVVAAGISYNVLKVREPFLGDYWGLTTRELSITAELELQNRVTLYPAVHTRQPGGWKRTRHPAADPTFTGVPSKIQIQPSRTEDRAGKRGFKKVFHIFVSADLPALHHGDLIKDEHSKQYSIESWTDRDRIDEYSKIVCSTPPGS